MHSIFNLKFFGTFSLNIFWTWEKKFVRFSSSQLKNVTILNSWFWIRIHCSVCCSEFSFGALTKTTTSNYRYNAKNKNILNPYAGSFKLLPLLNQHWIPTHYLTCTQIFSSFSVLCSFLVFSLGLSFSAAGAHIAHSMFVNFFLLTKFILLIWFCFVFCAVRVLLLCIIIHARFTINTNTNSKTPQKQQ